MFDVFYSLVINLNNSMNLSQHQEPVLRYRKQFETNEKLSIEMKENKKIYQDPFRYMTHTVC